MKTKLFWVFAISLATAACGDDDGGVDALTAAARAACEVELTCVPAGDPDAYADVDECVEDGTGLFPESCSAVATDLADCIGALTCTEFADFSVGDPTGSQNFPCKAEEISALECLLANQD